MKYNFTRRAGTGINSFGVRIARTHASKRPAFAYAQWTQVCAEFLLKFTCARANSLTLIMRTAAEGAEKCSAINPPRQLLRCYSEFFRPSGGCETTRLSLSLTRALFAAVSLCARDFP